MKRLYKQVQTGKNVGGFEILLDGRAVKTPGRKILSAPTDALAQAIAAEWAAQEEQIVPDSMPLTQILSTRIDRVEAERATMTAVLMKYLDTDLLCYRTENPPELAARQAEVWNPWLDWFTRRYGHALQTTISLRALAQPAPAHAAVSNHMKSQGDDAFTVLQLVTSLSGSLVLGLAFAEGAASPDQVFEACHVEEGFKAAIYDEARYGPDPLQEKKDHAMRRDLGAAA
ncbi:MAG: ATP12 chaperone family protein, partial [Alphaproteobacteria bacterium]|nr:ATP12 chaperone family protein [Alphaproteobacteria bacterium]